jgi:hypothetical protein
MPDRSVETLKIANATFSKTRFMLRLAIALLLWCSCAPLTSPEGAVPGAWREQEPLIETPSALKSYLEARSRLLAKAGPRPDFVLVVPFADESGFREGVWNVEYELANMFSIELEAIPEWRVVPFIAVAELTLEYGAETETKALQIARQLGADVVLLGLLQGYDMRRLSVGDPLLGGYKSYTAVAQMQVRVLRVVEGDEMGVVETLSELNDRDLGLDILGKPREQDTQFAGLKDLEFGSEGFRQTLIGKTTVEAIDDLVQKVAAVLKPGGIELVGVSPEIISVYGDDIYTNLGSEHGLRPRFRFAVYPGSDRAQAEGLDRLQSVAVVEVAEVVGARLSSLRVLSETGPIKPGDRLKLVETEGE